MNALALSSVSARAGVAVKATQAKAPAPAAGFSVVASSENKVSLPSKLLGAALAATIALAPLSANAGVQLVDQDRKKPFQGGASKGVAAQVAKTGAAATPAPAKESSDSPLPFIIAFPVLVFAPFVLVGALVPEDGPSGFEFSMQKFSTQSEGYAGNEVELKVPGAGKVSFDKKKGTTFRKK